MRWEDYWIAYPDEGGKRYDVAKLGPPDAWSDGGVVGRGELVEHDPTIDYEPSDWFDDEGWFMPPSEPEMFAPLWHVASLRAAEVTE